MYGYIDSNGNKHLLSGQQDIPQYTMEQYTALSVKPDIWVCTNYDSSSEYGIDSANVKYDNTHSVKDMIPKTKILPFTNKSNSDTSTYYIVLTNDLIGALNDNATEILSLTLAGWSGIQNIVTIGFENNILYMLYPKGHTFSNASVSVQVVYR